MTQPPDVLRLLWNPGAALEHPATAWMLGAAGAALVLGSAVVVLLGVTGRLNASTRDELRRRTLSWWVLAPLMVVPVLLGKGPTIAAVCLLSLMCDREFARATGLFREVLVGVVVVVGILLVNLSALDHWYGMFVAAMPITIALLVAVPIVQDRPQGYIQRVGLGVLGFALFGSCLGHLSYFANDAAYRPMLLMLLLTTELNDVFAYVTGRLMGRRKVAPNTSPNKTVGGSAGALVLTTLLTAWLGHVVLRGTPIDAPLPLITLGLLVSVGGQFGDLVLSSVKRDLGVKDLGVVIPGHGGLLDRFDSLLLVAPAVFHFVGYFNGVGLDQPDRIFTGQP
jgi:phosphatidate cytidylyltransferase